MLLDVEKAFDSVWQDGLWFKLSRMESSAKQDDPTSIFLPQPKRTVAVTVGNSVSQLVQLHAGTPQGSV